MSWAEAALVVFAGGEVVMPHTPPRRTAVHLPDSTLLWKTRAEVDGVAHIHPGRGPSARMPSTEDVTTFAAVERGLGRRLSWWIACAEGVTLYEHGRDDDGDEGYFGRALLPEPRWAPILRALAESGNGNGGER